MASDPTVKLRIETTGAAEARREIEQVAVTSDRVAKGALDTARAQNAAMAETSRVMLESARAKEIAAKATASEAEAMSVLEKQAKRAADQVERLALARGKSPEVAAGMADTAFEKVRTGASPAAAVWQARSGFAAEAAALRQIAAESARADTGLDKVGGTLAATTAKTNGLAAAGRLMANAFLPDMLVSRVLAGGRALVAVLAGMTAAAVGLTAVLGGVLLAAFLTFRSAMKESEEAGERLNRTIEEQSKLAEQAAERHDDLVRSMGQPLDAAEDAWRAVTEGASGYERGLARVKSSLDDILAIELRRIELAESEEKQRVRADYAPRLKAARSAVRDSEAAETKLATDYATRIRAADPASREALRRERDDALATQRAKTDAARDAERDLEADLRAKQESAATTAKVAAEEARLTHAREQAEIAAATYAKREEARLAAQAKSDALAAELDRQKSRFAASPDLAPHAGILNEKDPELRRSRLAHLQKNLADKGAEAAGLDKELMDTEGGALSGLLLNMTGGQDSVVFGGYRKNKARRTELGRDPASAARVAGDLLAADEASQKSEKAKAAAVEALADMATALSTMRAAATDAARKLAITRTDAAYATEDRGTKSADRAAAAANTAALRTAGAANDASLQRAAAAEVNAAGYELNNLATRFGQQGAGVDVLVDAARKVISGAAADGRYSKAELDAIAAALAQVADATKANAAATGEFRARLAAVESLAKQAADQVRTGGAR